MTTEGLTALEAATYCGISERSWYDLLKAGRAPAPVRLGRSTRWLRGELAAWLAAGCPTRATWERAKARASRFDNAA